MEAVILFAHGARDPAWAGPLKRVCETMRARQPGLRVELAFLEFMSPAFAEAVDRLASEGATRITVVPAFLSQGGHVARDLPELMENARQRHGGLTIRIVPAIGEAETVIGAIAEYSVMAAQAD